MRNTALIVVLSGFLLLVGLYGAVTVIYSRLSRAALPRRYAPELSESTHVYVHDIYMEPPCGVRVTGDGQNSGTMQVGFLRLPVSHQQIVGKLLMFLASVGGVALGAYVWRAKRVSPG